MVLVRALPPLFSIKKEQSSRAGLPCDSASHPLMPEDSAHAYSALPWATAPCAILHLAESAEPLTRSRKVPSGPQRMPAIKPRRKFPNSRFPGETGEETAYASLAIKYRREQTGQSNIFSTRSREGSSCHQPPMVCASLFHPFLGIYSIRHHLPQQFFSVLLV